MMDIWRCLRVFEDDWIVGLSVDFLGNSLNSQNGMIILILSQNFWLLAKERTPDRW